jgi:hypothetical protein
MAGCDGHSHGCDRASACLYIGTDKADARNAYERAAGQEDGLDDALEAQGLHRISDAAPEDDPWNYHAPDQRRARLPRLTALMG